MLIKLTNAANNPLKGNPLYINTEWIVSVYEVAREEGGSLVTVIYGGPLGISWEVEESLNQVDNLIRRSKNT